jgi:hypothetical protein
VLLEALEPEELGANGGLQRIPGDHRAAGMRVTFLR